MFAHIISPRRSSTYSGTPTYLSLAIGLVLIGGSVQAQAANHKQLYNELPVENVLVEYENNDSPQVDYKRQQDPKVTADDSKLSNKDFVAMKAQLFLECTQVQSSAARLACFDQVAQQGTTPSYTMTKQPLDLAKTFKRTISGNPQVVLAENVNPINGNPVEETDPVLATNQPLAQTYLDADDLAKSEAQILDDVGVTQSDIEKYTPLSLAYDLDQNSERGTWSARPHRPMYVLPVFFSTSPNRDPTSPTQALEDPFTSNEMGSTELKLQVSIKTKVAEDLFDTSADMWFGYSQQSHWQIYNGDNSRPFRATDYEPEIFITQPVTANLPFGGRLRMLGIGASHHSNGQSDPLSRSWNRAYLMGGAEWGKFAILPRLWTRISTEGDDKDDNPDIEDFMGYGDVTFLYDLPSDQSISGTVRYNTKTDKGAVQLDYIYPLSNNVNGYLQLFRGYGESIIDYNHKNTTIGVGIMLNDWKGL